MTDQMGKLLESLAGKTPASNAVTPGAGDTNPASSGKSANSSTFEYKPSDAILYALGGKSK